MSNKIIALRYSRDNPLATSRSLKKWWGERSLPSFWVVGLTTGPDFTVINDRYLSNERVSTVVLIFGIRFYKHVIMLYMYAKFYRAGSFKFIITFWWVIVERLNLVITY